MIYFYTDYNAIFWSRASVKITYFLTGKDKITKIAAHITLRWSFMFHVPYWFCTIDAETSKAIVFSQGLIQGSQSTEYWKITAFRTHTKCNCSPWCLCSIVHSLITYVFYPSSTEDKLLFICRLDYDCLTRSYFLFTTL